MRTLQGGQAGLQSCGRCILGGIGCEEHVDFKLSLMRLMSHRRSCMKSANNLLRWGTLVLLTGLNVSRTSTVWVFSERDVSSSWHAWLVYRANSKQH